MSGSKQQEFAGLRGSGMVAAMRLPLQDMRWIGGCGSQWPGHAAELSSSALVVWGKAREEG